MTYAEIIYIEEKNKDAEYKGFYLEFYGDNSGVSVEYKKELLEFYELEKNGLMFDYFFSGKYLVSKSFPYRFLSKRNFIPVSENFFYIK